MHEKQILIDHDIKVAIDSNRISLLAAQKKLQAYDKWYEYIKIA
jgi:hypothetical protein